MAQFTGVDKMQRKFSRCQHHKLDRCVMKGHLQMLKIVDFALLPYILKRGELKPHQRMAALANSAPLSAAVISGFMVETAGLAHKEQGYK